MRNSIPIMMGALMYAGLILPAQAQTTLDLICKNTQLTAADQSTCRAQMATAKTDAEKVKIQAAYENKIQASTAPGPTNPLSTTDTEKRSPTITPLPPLGN